MELVKANLSFENLMKKNPLFRAGGKRGASDNWRSFFYIKEHGEVTDTGLVIVNLVNSGVKFARYATWLAFEKQYPKIAMTCYNLGGKGIGISIGKNPFDKNNNIDLSKIAEQFVPIDTISLPLKNRYPLTEQACMLKLQS